MTNGSPDHRAGQPRRARASEDSRGPRPRRVDRRPEFDQLLIEAEPRLARDATVIAVLATVTPEMAVALGHLKRQGFAVSVILLAFDEVERIDSAGPLLAQGLQVRSVFLTKTSYPAFVIFSS